MKDEKNLYSELERLYKNILEKEDFFKINSKILLNYISIQESLPYDIYFKNQFTRLIKNDSLKKHIFIKKEKCDINIIDSIIKKVKDEESKKKENQNKLEKNKKENSKEEIPKDKIITSSQRDSKEEIPKDKIITSSQTFSKNNKNIKYSNDLKYKSCNKSTENNNSNTSNISIDLKIIQEKLEKKEGEIKEIIFQKEKILYQIINENNDSNNNRLTFFVDSNNLSGTQFENYGIKYLFELLNCLSVSQDFYFYYDISIKTDKINEIFKSYNLNEIDNIQLDFIIYNLKIIDFIN